MIQGEIFGRPRVMSNYSSAAVAIHTVSILEVVYGETHGVVVQNLSEFVIVEWFFDRM